ncbi:hypothetical protein R1flu_022997 [Riccia fluitans]|uniref:glutaredoxin-dependent peroxiredoxin n=1 Tax=Riccia fluitans TaxID=41844 RepID=A0ABD1XRA2_9MARC
MAPIAVGEKLPKGELAYIGENGVEKINVTEFAAGKKIVLFGVPGAFTPTCSLKHVPGFLDHGEEIKRKGVSAILCVSVNDPFVMDAWSKTYPKNSDIIKSPTSRRAVRLKSPAPKKFSRRCRWSAVRLTPVDHLPSCHFFNTVIF